jgi:hypothetical protein
METSVMIPAKDLDPKELPPRAWILTVAYWNDVAKDVVKALCVAFAIYLGGAIGGVFKVHPQIIAVGLIVVVAILADVALNSLLYRVKLRQRSRLVGAIGGGLIGAIVGGICGTLEATIVATAWRSLPAWVPTAVSLGIIIFAASIGDRILRRRIENKMISSIIQAESSKHSQ